MIKIVIDEYPNADYHYIWIMFKRIYNDPPNECSVDIARTIGVSVKAGCKLDDLIDPQYQLEMGYIIEDFGPEPP